MTDKTASLKLPDGKSLEFPVLSGSTGPDVIDIRPLYAKSGMFTYDPGFLSTASCTSAITYIDGDAGILLYRGYPIEQLAVHCDFLDVCYLLLNGELPNKAQKKEFVDIVTHHTMVHEQLARLYQGFRRDAHPMAVMVGVVGALSAFYHDALDINNPQHRTISAFRLIAKMPTIVAMSYKYSIGQPFVYPKNDLSFTANFMRMMFAVPAEEYKVNDVLVRAMDRIFILHADHEQNASTSTVRLCGSSGANPYACIAAGIASLWGPAHGGANEACLEMLEEIGDVSRIPEFIEKVKDKNSGVRLMGFGHRVYKNHDPRAKLMRETCHEVLDELGLHNDRLFKLALALEKIALEDLYEKYLVNRQAVADEWRDYFDRIQVLPGSTTKDVAHAPVVESFVQRAKRGEIGGAARTLPTEPLTPERLQVAALLLVTAYRIAGSRWATVDPLKRMPRPNIPELEPAYYDLKEADLEQVVNSGSFMGLDRVSLRTLIQALRDTYCRNIGFEYMFISDRVQRQWIQERIEPLRATPQFSAEQKKQLLQKLTEAEHLERYLHTRYVGQKRFSLEGGESLIPSIDDLIQRAGGKGVQEIVIGMAHRGRLNVLVNVLGKMPQDLFLEFEGKHAAELPSGDVKYHNGFSSDIPTAGGPVHLSLAVNPSHLQIVNPER